MNALHIYLSERKYIMMDNEGYVEIENIKKEMCIYYLAVASNIQPKAVPRRRQRFHAQESFKDY